MAREWVEQIKRDPKSVHWNVVLKPYGEPIDIANTALFLASDEASYFTGSILCPDGGITMH